MKDKFRAGIEFEMPGCGISQIFLPRQTIGKPDAASPESELVWYRLECHTSILPRDRGGEGGTDAPHILIFLQGSLGNSTGFYELDTPSDSYEQGDIDLHYIGTRDLGKIQSYEMRIYSDARNQVDAWTYSIWIDRYDKAGARWENNLFILHATKYTRNDRVPDRYRIHASVHVDAKDPNNPIVDAPASLPFDPKIHRPYQP